MDDRVTGPIIFWFRNDLRLSDNPGLIAAAENGSPVITVYVLDDVTPARWRLGGAARWWLHHSLAALNNGLAAFGGTLVLRSGEARQAIPALARETGARAVYWNRCYEPFAISRDEAIRRELNTNGIEARSFDASLMFEAWTVQNKQGEPFRIYTAFWRACLAKGTAPAPLQQPRRLASGPALPSDRLDCWRLAPSHPNWAEGFEKIWSPGESGAQHRLTEFLDTSAADYARHRDRLDLNSTSRLSPHLRFGEISPRQVWHAILAAHAARSLPQSAVDKFLSELGWREFAHHLLYHHPALPHAPLRAEFAGFPWQASPEHVAAWRQGRTGYPIVDAGMRELWLTGWMHNRVRMIAASFLVKHLLAPWQEGEAWFWDTLVDADLAANATNWQWVAGCGADAAPYFRIFNPVLQAERFDPHGSYVRRWVPELAALPDACIHRPWIVPESMRRAACATRDEIYPAPIIDHTTARRRALDAFARLKSSPRR